MEKIQKEGPELGLTLAFVWNRNTEKLKGLVPDEHILHNLAEFPQRYSAPTQSKRIDREMK